MAFPTTLDTFATISAGDTVSEAHPNSRGDSIETAQAKIGIDSSAVATSHDYLLTHLPAQVQNWDIGAYELRAQTFQSDIATGTAPFIVASTTVVTNLNADTVDGANAADFLKKDASVALTASWDVGTYTVTALRFVSDQGTGTAPFTVASTTVVTNLNADTLDAQHAPTGTIVGTSDTQTLTNKTLTAPDINGGTVDAITSLTVANAVDIGAYSLTASVLISDIAIGTAPLTITSTTLVSNLNADKLDSQEGSYYLDLANHTITSIAQGDIFFRGASAIQRLGVGTSGQYLKTQGASNNPTWATVTVKTTLDSLDDVTTITEAQGQVIYYDGTNWNALAVGTAGKSLVTGGAAANPSWASRAKMKTGSYTGDGAATKAITGVGFQPTFLIVHGTEDRGEGNVGLAMKSDQDTTGAQVGDDDYLDDVIISLDADGFTIGDTSTINESASSYHYIAFA